MILPVHYSEKGSQFYLQVTVYLFANVKEEKHLKQTFINFVFSCSKSAGSCVLNKKGYAIRVKEPEGSISYKALTPSS